MLDLDFQTTTRGHPKLSPNYCVVASLQDEKNCLESGGPTDIQSSHPIAGPNPAIASHLPYLTNPTPPFDKTQAAQRNHDPWRSCWGTSDSMSFKSPTSKSRMSASSSSVGWPSSVKVKGCVCLRGALKEDHTAWFHRGVVQNAGSWRMKLNIIYMFIYIFSLWKISFGFRLCRNLGRAMYSTFHKAFRQSILSPPFANEAKHTFMSAAVTRIQTRGGLRTQKQNDGKQIWVIKGSLGGETSVLRTFRMSGKELVKETVSEGKS